MKHSLTLALLVCAPLLDATSLLNFTNGQAAKAAFGQQSFGFAQTTASNQIAGGVSGLAWANGMLFVADGNGVGAQPINNRVLGFPTNYPELQDPHAAVTNPAGDGYCPLCGYNASTVIGQIDFTSVTPGIAAVPASNAAGSMWIPTAVATDGTVFAVADTNNNRVLIWNTIPSSPTVPPNVVLGQPDFTTRQQPAAVPSASTLIRPQGVWIQNGKLFVADTGNSRVLIWNSIPTSNGQAANVVLGEPNFQSVNNPPVTTTNLAASANLLLNPISVTSDGTHLLVSDFGYNRVLIWNSVPTQNGQAADVVVGQVDFTQAIANNRKVLCASNGTDSTGALTYPGDCAKTLDHPRYALSDGTRLFVADSGNDRVLIYNQVPTSNTTAADIVLGQPDFTSNIITTQAQSIASTTIDNTGSVDTIPSPMGLAFDGINLYVSDALNRRVLVYQPGDISIGQKNIKNTASKLIQQEGFVILADSSIVAKDTVTVTIQGTAYTYTLVAGDTLDSITKNVIDTINGKIGGGKPDPNVTAHAGAIAGTVFLSSTGTNNAFDSVTLAATTSNTANITATASGGYLNGGNSGTAAPGTLVEIDDPNLDANGNVIPGLELADFTASADTTVTVPAILKDPKSQASVQVFMDGTAAPVLTASPTQIVAQAPFEYSNRNSVSVYVRRVHPDGTVSVTIASPLILAPASPGLFSIPGTNEPRPAMGALHQNGNPSATISIDGSVQVGDSLQITVNGRNYSYTAQSTDSLASIASALVTAINNGNDPQVTAQRGGAFARVVVIARQPGAAGNGIPVSGKATAASGKTSATETVTAYTSSTCCTTSATGPVTIGNPAQPNEIITLLATGLGLVLDSNGTAISVPTGAPYTGPQPNSASNSVNGTVSTSTGQIISAGLAPGGVGVYNVQILMPATLPANGVAPVYIAQNAFISNTVTIPVGAPGSSPVHMFIDAPNAKSTNLGGVVTVVGWAADDNAAITNVSVYLDGVLAGAATYGDSRPDVCAAYPSSVGCANGKTGVGWHFPIDTTRLARGTHTIYVTASSSDAQQNTAFTSLSLTNPVRLYIDAPQSGTSINGSNINLVGWATSVNALITRVAISIDGNSPVNAVYGASRPDVCVVFPTSVGCPVGNVGWNFTYPSTLANGTHVLTVTATDAAGSHGTVSSSFTVAGVASGTAMYVDVPGGGRTTVAGVTTFRGWAVNSSSSLASVTVAIDGSPAINAVLEPRVDVCNAYPATVGCPNVGWNLPVDTTLLANGTHTLTVTAKTASGQPSVTSGTFSVANWAGAGPVRVYIDNPYVQSTLSGTATLVGWALNDTGTVSQVVLSVDGVPLTGAVNLGTGRPDVCVVFPGRQGCPNVGWSSQLDTTLLGDGVHTLTATAIGDGIKSTASRTFTVANQSTSTILAYIDRPNQSALSGPGQVIGWAVGKNAAVDSVMIIVDGVTYGTATYGASRPDVCEVYPTTFACLNGNSNVGWSFPLDSTLLAPGTHTMQVRSTAGGQISTIAKQFTIASSANGILIYADVPNAFGPSTFIGKAILSGWAISNTAAVDSVALSIDGVPYGTATYGESRPDVCAYYPQAVCPGGNVGWSSLLDTTQLSDGNHILDVTAASGGQHATISTNFTVANLTSTSLVKIYIDNPNIAGTVLSGVVNAVGWAISDDGPVSQVLISVDGGTPQPATYFLGRPDVCRVFPGRAGCPNVGWNYQLDTTLLADGMHTLEVTATALGQNSTVSTTFNVANF